MIGVCCNHNIRQLTLKVNVFSLVAYIIILPVKDHHGEDTAGGGGGASDDPVIESADNRGSLNPMPTPIPVTERNKGVGISITTSFVLTKLI